MITYAVKDVNGDYIQEGSITLSWSPVLDNVEIFAGRKFDDGAFYEVHDVIVRTGGIENI